MKKMNCDLKEIIIIKKYSFGSIFLAFFVRYSSIQYERAELRTADDMDLLSVNYTASESEKVIYYSTSFT